MTRNDLILSALLIILSLTPLVTDFASEKTFALVKVSGEVVGKFELTAEESFTLTAGGGKNFVEIKGGAVSVTAADCPDKICVRRGAIKNVGEVIACVPHKVLIEVVGD